MGYSQEVFADITGFSRSCYAEIEIRYLKLLHFIGYNVPGVQRMNNKTYSTIQIIILASLILAIVLQALLFFNVSARMDAIEQKQVVIERHMDVLRDAQINTQPLRSYPN